MGKGTSRRGRGSALNPDPRYSDFEREAVDDGWTDTDPAAPKIETTVSIERVRSLLNRNQSPDVPFEYSINPYRGCEHGCSYCYARPAHAYADLSPGLDFETKLFAKAGAAPALRLELSKPGYRCSPIALGANTDPYQPIEKQYRVTRSIIEVLADARHPFSIVTKSSLVERDLDLLAPMAERGLVEVYLSVTSLDRELARRMEPRAAAPQRRLRTLAALSELGIPCGVMFAPVVPALNDQEMEVTLQAAKEAGACYAGYVLLRLPREVKQIFKDWLQTNYPLKAERVMARVRDLRGGGENDANFGTRMKGTGTYAHLLARRFKLSCQRLGLNRSTHKLDTSQFVAPRGDTPQLPLF